MQRYKNPVEYYRIHIDKKWKYCDLRTALHIFLLNRVIFSRNLCYWNYPSYNLCENAATIELDIYRRQNISPELIKYYG